MREPSSVFEAASPSLEEIAALKKCRRERKSTSTPVSLADSIGYQIMSDPRFKAIVRLM